MSIEVNYRCDGCDVEASALILASQTVRSVSPADWRMRIDGEKITVFCPDCNPPGGRPRTQLGTESKP